MQSMKLHIVMHEYFEAPAAIATWAEKKGHETTYTRLYSGDTLPEKCDFDFLVVMGGPQSPATTVEESPHFDAKKEEALIKAAVDQGKLVFGVCLGAQLIGEALGAAFDHSPNREIGVYPVTLTEDGKQDSIVSTFPEAFPVGHWHGDMPGLTPEAKILAVSEGCPRQIVRYTPKVYGFQCHFEFTPTAVEDLIENDAEALEQFESLPYVETPDVLRSHDYTQMNQLLFGFLDKFTA
jgi:GMP synthase (glutamine-hydrolysing)